jgi:hypothetical protein
MLVFDDGYSEALEKKEILLRSIDDLKEREKLRDRIDRKCNNAPYDKIAYFLNVEINNIYGEILKRECNSFSTKIKEKTK